MYKDKAKQKERLIERTFRRLDTAIQRAFSGNSIHEQNDVDRFATEILRLYRRVEEIRSV